MRLQIVSDIHLEFRNNYYPFIHRRAPNIALLGDIGKPHSHVYMRLIRDLSRRFERVIIIAGNHEYYRSGSQRWTVYEIQEKLYALASEFDNVCFLERQTTYIDGVRILGATLWTNIPHEQWVVMRKKINDYSMITLSRDEHEHAPPLSVPLSPAYTTRWHEETVEWIKDELDAPGTRDTPTVILTHHAPSTHNTSDPRYHESPLQTAYSTDLECLFRAPVVAWAFGHTHYPCDRTTDEGIRIVSNPVGYPNELPGEAKALERPPVIEIF